MGWTALVGETVRASAADESARPDGPFAPALVAPKPGTTAQRDAALCIAMFLCAAVGQRKTATECLATPLFALGALDAAADRAALGRAARTRLEADILQSFCGAGRRRISGWRRALRDFERTRRGWRIRCEGEAALHAWLRGESPAPYLARVLAAP